MTEDQKKRLEELRMLASREVLSAGEEAELKMLEEMEQPSVLEVGKV